MNHYLAEFIGTTLLLLLGNGVVANVILKGTKGENGGWIVITTAWALAVYVGVVFAGPYTGAHLNPAVTIAVALNNGLSWTEVPGYILAQIAGGFCGAMLTYFMHKDHFDATSDATTKLGVFATIPNIRNTSTNLVSEIIGTFVLIFAIFFITGQEITINEKTEPIGMGSLGAIPVAFVVWAIGLSLGGTTGYAINPARDLGPRLFHALWPIKGKGSSDWSYAWIPILGPIIGAILAFALYICIKPA
ncbi:MULTISPECIES: MIP/aquaporin family protein [unclassified Sphingobacterium]|uniref:MIP/aquaporin family protein n=1 Tax=unclassified Sphingobacterium TaxID=2609468 RepID=UPI0025EBDACD|nr:MULTISPECIES: MIP/aquaporin family protein [unclassified Sphingobacterium]